MATQPKPPLTKKTIPFPNDNEATLVTPPRGAHAAEVLDALGIGKPNALILIIGSADKLDELDADKKSLLAQLFSRGIARAADTTGALIIDGGTDAGVMAMMGQGVADRGGKSKILGVAPAGRVTYPGAPNGNVPDAAPLEPNHSYFVLVDSNEWGGETGMMFDLVSTLAAPEVTASPSGDGQTRPVPVAKSTSAQPDAGAIKTRTTKIPTVVILVGGNLQGISKTEALHAVRQGLPLIVIEETGELADQIAKLYRNTPNTILDPALAEIVNDGNLHLFQLGKSVAALEQLIIRELGVNETLQLAWRRFASYDIQALRYQKNFAQLQRSILILGGLLTFLVVLKSSLGIVHPPTGAAVPIPSWIANWTFLVALSPDAQRALTDAVALLDALLFYAILILPIVISILLAISTQFNEGGKWVLLRGSAETLKRAIFVYRTRRLGYVPPALPPTGQASGVAPEQQQELATREGELAHKVEFTSRQLMQTDVNLSALPEYDGPIPPPRPSSKKYGGAKDDDGISFLTPERYIQLRLDDQIAFFRNRTVRLERERRIYRVLVLLAGGIGTFLAAIGFQLWVAFTTALATAFTTYLQYRQTENTLTQYNQTATNLENVKGWWVALSAEDQADPKKIRKLVETTEDVLASEQTGWVQQMQDALSKLRQEQTQGLEPQKETVPQARPATGQPAQPQPQPKPAATPTAKPPETAPPIADATTARSLDVGADGVSDNQT